MTGDLLSHPPIRITLHQNPGKGRTNVAVTIKNNENAQQSVQMGTSDAREFARLLLNAARDAEAAQAARGYTKIQPIRSDTLFWTPSDIVQDDQA